MKSTIRIIIAMSIACIIDAGRCSIVTGAVSGLSQVIGLQEVTKNYSQILGRNVHIALVELSQEEDDPSKAAFLPNFDHKALARANWRYLYSYDNPYLTLTTSQHATRIAGILVGYDETAYCDGVGDFRFRGIIPEATIDVYETNWFIYKRVLSQEPEPMNTDVVSISWGTNASDAVTLWWQRGIDALAESENIIIAVACGNGDDQGHTINKPACGYNVISVGAARNLGDYPDFLNYVGPPAGDGCSFGPLEDGRCKPDILAPGVCIAPDVKNTDGYICDKSAIGYSSFAAPEIAGIAGLLVDAARGKNLEYGDDPRVIRALLMNGAIKLTGWHKGRAGPEDDREVPLDYWQGAGLVNVWNSFRQLMAGRYRLTRSDENNAAGDKQAGKVETASRQVGRNWGWDFNYVKLDEREEDSERVYYLPQPLEPGQYLTATLCWYRHYRREGNFPALPMTWLALELWATDEEGHLLEMLDTSESSVDNIQHIYYHNDKRQKVALLVSGWCNEELKRGQEQYGLAYRTSRESWHGDLLAGDFNADGIIDFKDLKQFLGVWSSWMTGRPQAEKSRTGSGNVPVSGRSDINASPGSGATYKAGIDPDANRSDSLDYLPEDLDGDGRVGKKDLDLLMDHWLQHSAWYKTTGSGVLALEDTD